MNIPEMLDAVRELQGDYAECGVWQGHVAQQIHARVDFERANLYLFDSFSGHAAPGEFDDAVHHPQGRYRDTSPELINRLCPKARIVPGWLPSTLKAFKAYRFRFVHIDVDHYWPTRTCCEFFKTRMVPGGIIRFDDYGFSECPGATKAIDEVFGRDNILPGDYRWISQYKEI